MPSNFVHTDELTTNRRRGDFGNVERSQVGSGTDTESSDDTTTVDRSESSSAVSSEHLLPKKSSGSVRNPEKEGESRDETYDTSTEAEDE